MQLRTALRSFLAVATLGLCGCGEPSADSLLLVSIDTLRADHLGLAGHHRDTTPRLDALAASAAVFQRAWAPSPWTLPSVASLLTGAPPPVHGAGRVRGGSGSDARRRFAPLAPGVRTLAERLGAAGLATGAVVNNPFLHASLGLSRGFETWDHVAGNRRRIRRAAASVDRAVEWLEARAGAPFFLYVHLFDPHLNYDAPPPFRGRFAAPGSELPDGALEHVRQALARGETVDFGPYEAAYDEEIASVDAAFSRLLAALARLGAERRTLVVLTADHGEEFGDHGGFEHGHTLYDELLRVPLLLWGPGVEPGRRSRPASLVDVAPTALAALGLEVPAELPGRELLAARDSGPRTLFAGGTLYGAEREAALRWPWKAIVDRRSGARELYRLDRDPAERADLAAAHPAELAALERELAARAEALPPAAPATVLDAETLRELRSLGYLD